jgi:ParB-like chromosome segregation protein Spo0J
MPKETTSPFPVVMWPVENLIPYALNAKKHSEEQVEKLATVIRKFGWDQPITVWKNGDIIAGHGRRLAALHLKMEKVPVVVRDDLTKAEADALRLADNRVTSVEYDMEMVQEELRRLQEELDGSEINLADMGFDEKELTFSLSDLSDIDDSFFTDDVNEAVDQQRRENEESVKTADETAAPVGDALGFKRISIMQSREISGYMGKIEDSTGMTGPEALIRFFQDKMGAA